MRPQPLSALLRSGRTRRRRPAGRGKDAVDLLFGVGDALGGPEEVAGNVDVVDADVDEDTA